MKHAVDDAIRPLEDHADLLDDQKARDRRADHAELAEHLLVRSTRRDAFVGIERPRFPRDSSPGALRAPFGEIIPGWNPKNPDGSGAHSGVGGGPSRDTHRLSWCA